jgi:hypothetical protein
MNKNSRSGSLTSEFSVKAVGLTIPDDQLIAALVKRILSKVVTQALTDLVVFWDCAVDRPAGTR